MSRPGFSLRLGVAALVVGSCAQPYVRHPSGYAVIDLVEVRDANLSWGGAQLRADRQQVERSLRRLLQVRYKPSVIGCGSHWSETEISGRTMTLQWSGPEERAKLETIEVPLTAEESRATAWALAQALRRRLPDLVVERGLPQAGPAAEAVLLHPQGNASQSLLLKAGAENVMFIALQACFD